MATWNDLIDNVGDELALDNFKSTGADKSVLRRAIDATINNMFSKHAFSWNVVTTPLVVTLVINQVDYDLSSIGGGVKIQHIFDIIVDTGDTRSAPLTEKTLGWFNLNVASVKYDAARVPVVYATIGKYGIKVAPKPAKADTLDVYYTLEHAAITDFTVAITVPDRVQETLELGMLARAYRYLHEFEMATSLYALYINGRAELIEEDLNKPDLTFTLQPYKFGGRTSNVEPWKTPFA